MSIAKCLLSVAFCAKLLRVTFALSNPIHRRSKTAQTLQVWDDVLPHKVQRQTLHEFASKSGLGHSCFSRPLQNRVDRNIIELTLDAILTEIERNSVNDFVEGKQNSAKDGRQYVEYWSRQEWRHIEAHADVDENLAKIHDKNSPMSEELYSSYPSTYQEKSGGYRYPMNGHVLYLQVGTDVKGPTCVFPGHSSGGELLQANCPVANANNKDQSFYDSIHMDESDNVQMIVVPATPGRLLRFNGADLHAVPRPHDLWMLPYISGSSEFEPETVWGRSVILFNVWPGDEDPPLGVPLDAPADLGGVGSIVKEKEKSPFCNSFSDWKAVPPSPPKQTQPTVESQSKQAVKVWLLGNERRRGYPMRTVPLLPPPEGGLEVVREALSEKSKVTELWLRKQ